MDPRRYPTTDILWASPPCTNHSIARGGARHHQTEALRTDLLDLLEAGKQRRYFTCRKRHRHCHRGDDGDLRLRIINSVLPRTTETIEAI